MVGLCEGRVCIVTGAGRGIGREHSLHAGRRRAPRWWSTTWAARWTARATRPARPSRWSRRSRPWAARRWPTPTTSRLGGRREAGGARPSTPSAASTCWSTTPASCATACSTNMTEAEWDAVIKVHLKGTAGPSHFAAAYWREQSKAGEAVDGAHHQHQLAVGHLRQRGPDQLRRGQGRHRRLHHHRLAWSWPATASPSTPSPRPP